MSTSFLDALDPQRRYEQLAGRAGDPADPTELFVGAASGEVWAIYTAPEHWGRGIGRALMSQAVDRLSQLGFVELRLWVLEDNARARRFYEALGWSWDGGRQTYEVDGVALPEVRYRHSASDPSP